MTKLVFKGKKITAADITTENDLAKIKKDFKKKQMLNSFYAKIDGRETRYDGDLFLQTKSYGFSVVSKDGKFLAEFTPKKVEAEAEDGEYYYLDFEVKNGSVLVQMD